MYLPGPLIDIFDPDLPILDGVRLEPGQSGLYRDVSALLNRASGEKRQNCVLHTTHRLMSQYHAGAVSRITLRGPAETPAVVRLYGAGRGLETIIASDADGEILDVASQRNGETLKLQFPNHPQGTTLEIRWSP